MEEFAEEKVSEQLNIKTKYQRMIAMTKAKPDCTEDKLKAMEEKKRQEEAKLQTELVDKKNA